ncbi:MAG: CBS domain-containing protein [Campylobacterota bacterium]|nr:CBS domain-containing protein [Campylobacterota bacterium]
MIISKVIKTENYSIDKNASINDVTKLMSKNKDGFVVFVHNYKVIGIITERDLVSYIISEHDYTKNAYQYAQKNVVTFKQCRKIDYVLTSIIEFEIRRVVVVDDKDNFVGVTTQEHLIKHIDGDAFKTKMKLFDINRLYPLITKDKNDSISSTFECMKNNNIGSIVITENNNPIGIITERDIVTIISQNKTLNNPVHTVMSSPLITIDISSTVDETLHQMNRSNIQRIIVKDNNDYKMVGIRDILHVIKGNYGLLVEKKLKHSKMVLNTITEAIIELYNINEEYIIHWCNKRAFDIFGSNIIDKNITSLIDKNMWNNIFKTTIEMIQTDKEFKIQIDQSYFKIKCICDDLKEKDSFRLILVDITKVEKLNIKLQEVIDEKTRSLKEINETLEKKVEDAVKENKTIMEQLIKSEKMAAIGELIQNLSHQWRQPLSVISSAATGLKLQHELDAIPPKGLEKTCDIINNSAQYLSNTIEEFKKFTQHEEELVDFNIKDSINSFLHMEDIAIVNNHIKIICELPDNIYVNGYPNEFIQCFMGMFNNSLEVLVENNIKKKYIIITHEIKKDKIILRFKDNGGGTTDDIIQKVFDPYFTTKHQSQGTGLGLHMIYNLITDAMKGHIDAHNDIFEIEGEKYNGLEFAITLNILDH